LTDRKKPVLMRREAEKGSKEKTKGKERQGRKGSGETFAPC